MLLEFSGKEPNGVTAAQHIDLSIGVSTKRATSTSKRLLAARTAPASRDWFMRPRDDSRLFQHTILSDQRKAAAKSGDYACCAGVSLLCKLPVLPDRDDRQFCRRKVLVQNMKRIQEAAFDDDIIDGSPRLKPRRGHGSTELVASFGGRGRKASGPGKT